MFLFVCKGVSSVDPSHITNVLYTPEHAMWQRFSDLTSVQLRVKRRLWTAFVLDSNIQIQLYDSLICSRSELKIMEFHAVLIWLALIYFQIDSVFTSFFGLPFSRLKLLKIAKYSGIAKYRGEYDPCPSSSSMCGYLGLIHSTSKNKVKLFHDAVEFHSRCC